jgi:hypothetical protein
LSDDDDSPPDADDAAVEATVDEPRSIEKAKRAESKAKREAREVEEFWQRTLATEEGRRAIWELLKAGGLGAEREFGVGPNGFPHPEVSWFKLGARDYAERMLEMWDVMDGANIRLMRCENDPRYGKARR